MNLIQTPVLKSFWTNKMRCTCCDKNLNDFESTRKHAETGEYLDICNQCIAFIDIPTTTRSDLEPTEQIDMDDDEFDENFGEEYD